MKTITTLVLSFALAFTAMAKSNNTIDSKTAIKADEAFSIVLNDLIEQKLVVPVASQPEIAKVRVPQPVNVPVYIISNINAFAARISSLLNGRPMDVSTMNRAAFAFQGLPAVFVLYQDDFAGALKANAQMKSNYLGNIGAAVLEAQAATYQPVPTSAGITRADVKIMAAAATIHSNTSPTE